MPGLRMSTPEWEDMATGNKLSRPVRDQPEGKVQKLATIAHVLRTQGGG